MPTPPSKTAFRLFDLLLFLPFFSLLQVDAQATGTGTTTRYWDCCKPSCAWSGKAALAAGAGAVQTCDISNNPLADLNAQSACNGGSAYMCANESPWAVSNSLSYGYAAVHIAGGSEASWCCACYELTFTSGPVTGKKMIVQATNTGGDLNSNQFDLSIPGGGFGIFNGCTQQFGTPTTGWGAQYGGIASRSQCDAFPAALQAGCYWRWDWFQGADNPAVTFRQVACPAAISTKTSCVRADDGSMPEGDAIDSEPRTGAGGLSSSTSAAKTTTTSTIKTTAAVSTKIIPQPPPTSPQSSPPQPKYAQCGGINWTGGKVCVAGTTCKYNNDWYSQCL